MEEIKEMNWTDIFQSVLNRCPLISDEDVLQNFEELEMMMLDAYTRYFDDYLNDKSILEKINSQGGHFTGAERKAFIENNATELAEKLETKWLRYLQAEKK